MSKIQIDAFEIKLESVNFFNYINEIVKEVKSKFSQVCYGFRIDFAKYC